MDWGATRCGEAAFQASALGSMRSTSGRRQIREGATGMKFPAKLLFTFVTGLLRHTANHALAQKTLR